MHRLVGKLATKERDSICKAERQDLLYWQGRDSAGTMAVSHQQLRMKEEGFNPWKGEGESTSCAMSPKLCFRFKASFQVIINQKPGKKANHKQGIFVIFIAWHLMHMLAPDRCSVKVSHTEFNHRGRDQHYKGWREKLQTNLRGTKQKEWLPLWTWLSGPCATETIGERWYVSNWMCMEQLQQSQC